MQAALLGTYSNGVVELDEPIAKRNGNDKVYMHSVSVLEVYYDAIKRIENDKADLFLTWIFNDSPIKILYEITENTIRDAGHFKYGLFSLFG